MYFFILFYVNYLWLVPRLAEKGKWLSFTILAALLIVVMGLASGKFYERLFTPPPEVIERVRQDEQRQPGGDDQKTTTGDDQRQTHDDDRGKRRGGGMALYNFFITSFLVSGFAVGLRYAESALTERRGDKGA